MVHVDNLISLKKISLNKIDMVLFFFELRQTEGHCDRCMDATY